MKTVVAVTRAALAGLVGLPEAERVINGFQADLRENLSCTAATYAALDADATEADYARGRALSRGPGVAGSDSAGPASDHGTCAQHGRRLD
jgi:hypothetical protein